MEFQKHREVAPFFNDAINQVFLQPSKQIYTMDGAIGTGKSSNFLMWGAYQISQCVEPVQQHKRMVRESLWAGIRESENSAVATFLQLLENAIFSPEIMSAQNSPVELIGSHPRYIRINHELEDGTFLDMKIECHGFNNDKAFNRLKTREYLGALIPEAQGIPFLIITTASERCGRWRTENLKITKTIDGKEYTLSGLEELGITLCDVNIPERPHALYDNYYDSPNQDKLPYLFLTPPEPLIYKPVDSVPEAMLEKYPVTRFEGEEVVWFPNPECYHMTRHFEKKDEHGNNIPWTGYNLWFRELHRSDSEVRRYVLGRPDTVGGSESVYMNFAKNKKTIVKRELNPFDTVYIGFDPGKYAAYMFCQPVDGKGIHYFHEIIVEPSDGVRTRQQLTSFVFPYIKKKLKGCHVVFVPDPAAFSGTGTADSPVNIIKDIIASEEMTDTVSIQPCLVPNQNTEARINTLGYFIDKAYCTIDPSLKVLIKALTGGYRYKKLKSGVISDTIDKGNPYSHPAEAAQYPAINIRHLFRKKGHGKNNTRRTIYKIRHTSK